MSWQEALCVIGIVFILPFVLGVGIARALKLKDTSTRIGVVLMALLLGLTPFAWQQYQGRSWDEAIKRGIDLAGGTNMVFQVRFDQTEKDITDKGAVMDKMVASVMRRLDPANQEQITVRRVGDDRIEVIIPGADQQTVDEKKALISKLGSLEFAVLANQRKAEHRGLITRAQNVETNVIEDMPDGSKRVAASWRPVGAGQKVVDGKTETYRKDVETYGQVEWRERQIDGESVKQFLVVFEPEGRRVTGKYLASARPGQDQAGKLTVDFTFTQKGGNLFTDLTNKYKPERDGFKHRLAVLLDGEIHSAPQINDVIGSRGQISGDFSMAEINELIAVLNAGALEVPIDREPINEFTVGPTLAEDVQQKGMFAIALAMGVVLVFMIGYYLFSGVVADLCLLLNLVLVMGTMALINATFTLPGLAGIVLTIGMAVDANVLIFERIREELNRGSSLRMAIQNGFGRAFTTIVDANVTTLITAIVLYMIGTDQVRGFAVTLFIGIVMSMFSALFFGRLLFDIFERKRWITSLKMFSIVGQTKWNFLGKQKIAAIISVALIATGLATLVSRGEDNLDIDFTGGTMVTFEFTEPHPTPIVEEKLEAKFIDGVDLVKLVRPGTDASADSTQFRMRTKLSDADLEGDQTVAKLVAESFEGSSFNLRRVTMSQGEVDKIEQPEPGSAETVEAEYIGGHAVNVKFVDSLKADASATAEVETEKTTDDTADGDTPAKKDGKAVVKLATAKDYIAGALGKITDENGNPKYPDPLTLLTAEYITSWGLEEVSGDKFRMTEMQIAATPAVSLDDLTAALNEMQTRLNNEPLFDEVNSFDKAVAGEMQQSALMAMLFSLLAIIGYIWFRFQRITFGLAAVVALVHDVLIVVGMVAVASLLSATALGQALDLYDFKINLAMIAAFLTIVGYSLNDTIVVFDRIREVRGKNPSLTFDMVNLSLNQTLARTLLTSLTTFIVVGILYAFGGEGIHGFAFCLVLGVIVGTYSSIYIASPTLLWLMNRDTANSGNLTPQSSPTKTAAAG